MLDKADKSQIPDSESGGLDLAQKCGCDGARLGQIQKTTLSNGVHRTTVINVFVCYKPSVIQPFSRADSV